MTAHTKDKCTHEECLYLKDQESTQCECGGTKHTIASNWDDYCLEHGIGNIWFLTACDKCADINTGNCLGLEWSDRQIQAARSFKIADSEDTVTTKNGLFIVLEGLDGAGTTTQSSRLATWLREQGHTVHTSFEPSDGPVGRLIRKTLIKEPGSPDRLTLPWMFAADRADHLYRMILPAITSGTIAISDRYTPSSLAYQSMEYPMQQIYDLNARFQVPDLVLYLEIDVATAMGRITSREKEREIFEHYKELNRACVYYYTAMNFLKEKGWPIVTIDATASMDEVTSAVQLAVESAITCERETTR